jgi:predicted deacylase
MKTYILSIFLISSYFMAFAQDTPFHALLSKRQPGVTDTVFKIVAKNNVTVEIPVTIIKGRLKGPTFTIIAGIHGMEYPPILSLLELRREIDPTSLAGNIIIIPIVNQTSFYTRTPFVNPLDGLNLNRSFPGNPAGTITEVMADFLTREVFSATDVLLDMHGGDVSEDLIPFICYYDNQEFKKQTALAARLSEISGFETVVSYPYVLPGDQPAMYAFKQAVRQGITALSIEIGRLGNWKKEEVSFAKKSIFRMMAELKMYGSKSVENASAVKVRYHKQAYVSVPVQGIFISELTAGDHITKGTEVGYITDIFGKKLKIIYAPESGVILYKIGTPPVNEGETLLCIGF